MGQCARVNPGTRQSCGTGYVVRDPENDVSTHRICQACSRFGDQIAYLLPGDATLASSILLEIERLAFLLARSLAGTDAAQCSIDIASHRHVWYKLVIPC